MKLVQSPSQICHMKRSTRAITSNQLTKQKSAAPLAAPLLILRSFMNRTLMVPRVIMGGLPQPWGTELSHIIILVLIGWLFVGQGCGLDFNIFVKSFCILALPD